MLKTYVCIIIEQSSFELRCVQNLMVHRDPHNAVNTVQMNDYFVMNMQSRLLIHNALALLAKIIVRVMFHNDGRISSERKTSFEQEMHYVLRTVYIQ